MPVYIIYVVDSGYLLIRGKELVSLHAGCTVYGLQFLIHRCCLRAGIGKIVLQHKLLAAAALLGRNLHPLPTAILLQGAHDAHGNADYTDDKQGDGSDPPQFLILLRKLHPFNGLGFSHSITLSKKCSPVNSMTGERKITSQHAGEPDQRAPRWHRWCRSLRLRPYGTS